LKKKKKIKKPYWIKEIERLGGKPQKGGEPAQYTLITNKTESQTVRKRKKKEVGKMT